MTAEIHLQNNAWSVSVRPAEGGCISKASYKGIPVLREQLEPGAFGAGLFTMLPYSNRIKDGRFTFAGKSHQLRPNRDGDKYPLHGEGWDAIWKVESADAESCILCLDYLPESGRWPWRFLGRQEIRIVGNNLLVKLEMTNTDDVAYPAGIGIHPFFAQSQTAQVQFDAEGIWEAGADLIPVGFKRLNKKNDFSKLNPVKGKAIDNCYGHTCSETRIKWSGRAEEMIMSASKLLRHLVIYMDEANDFFCIEPVSHPNNALNMVGDNSLLVLQPGEGISGEVCFSL